MSVIDSARQLYTQMSPVEKSNFIRWAMLGDEQNFPGIEKTPGICGGSACIIRTRIPVWSLIEYMQMGLDDATLLKNFPSLRFQDLENARNYYWANKEEIEQEIRENNED